MAVKLSPIWSGTQFFNSAGNVLSGGQIFQYLAGTTTPQQTFTDYTGLTPNANPITLDSAGRYSSQIWFTAGVNYKLILKDSGGTTILTEDNLTGVNDTSGGAFSEWLAQPTPTYVSGTSFAVPGNLTTTFQVGRRVQAQINSGFIYGTISSSAFTSVTTVVLVNDSGSLDNTLSAVSVGLLGEVNPSVPAIVRYFQGVTDGSDASAGVIGEYITSGIITGVSLTTGVAANVTSISLTAGDWDVSARCNISFSNTTTWNLATCVISNISGGAEANDPHPIISLSTTQTSSVVAGTGIIWGGAIGTKRYSLNTTTTIYLVAQANFGTSTASSNGVISARRIR